MNTIPLIYDLESTELLDWQSVIDALVKNSHFNATKHSLRVPPDRVDLKAIEYDYSITDSFILHYEQLNSLHSQHISSLPSEHNVYEIIPFLKKHRVFEIQELNIIAKIIETSGRVTKTINELFPQNNFLYCDHHKNLTLFTRRFRELVDHNGEIQYHKEPRLNKLLKKLTQLEGKIRHLIQTISQSKSFHGRLQYETYDIINDRFVLAVRSDSYESQLGPIISKSASSLTLFVEPFDLRNLANERLVIRAEIDAVIEQICREFSQMLSDYSDIILNKLHFLQNFDDFNSRASFALTHKLNRPQIDFNNKRIELHDAFHPLLNEPVKNDITINDSEKGLIISGPNTGGKTVLLKSIALCYLFFYKGLFVPAKKAKIFPFNQIFYFSNDFQDIGQGLSSFASESLRYLNMINNIQSSSLVIIDEIFNSTSSEEASSLALGLLDLIYKKNQSKVVLSTHHQMLKTMIHSDKTYISSHMLFDLENNRPLYKIQYGEPGSSLAFVIFDKLVNEFFGGATELKEITLKAGQVYDKKQMSYESLLQEVSQKNAQLTKLLRENRDLNSELKNQKKSMEGVLTLEKQKLLEDFNRKINTLLSRARQLKAESAKLTKKDFEKQESEIKRSISQIQGHQNKVQPKHKDVPSLNIDDIHVGQSVCYQNSKESFKVVRVDTKKGKVLIARGAIKITASASQLHSTEASNKRPKIIVSVPEQNEGTYLKTEIDCRGMRLSEFQNLVHNYLDHLLRGNIPFLNIIHGHGDGVLKKWLRDHLKDGPHFRWISPEGNDGSTEVHLSE